MVDQTGKLYYYFTSVQSVNSKHIRHQSVIIVVQPSDAGPTTKKCQTLL